MIRIRNTVTDEVQHVESLEGAGEDWEQVGDALPDQGPWDGLLWDGEAWLLDPQVAHDRRWEEAKAYRDIDRYFATLPVADVVPGEVVMVECDANSRRKVTDLAQAATWATMRAEPFSITFTDGNNQPFTVSAEQTIAIKAAVTLNDALCHAASQVVRAALATALAEGATAAEIEAIDITAGYPAEEP